MATSFGTVDVVVVGLGPAGAATAIRLARAGLSVLAVDRATFPREKVCSEYLSPETVRQLDLLGALDRVRPYAVPLDGAQVLGPRGSSLLGLFKESMPATFTAPGLSVSRRILDALLVDVARAAGVTVLERTRVLDVIRVDGAVTGIVVRQGDQPVPIGARAVVGADGLHSIVSRALGGRRFEPLRRYAFVAHVANVPGVGSTAEMHVGDGVYVGLNSIGSGLTNVAVVASARVAREAAHDPSRFWFSMIERFPALRERIDPDAIVRAVMATGPFATWSKNVTTNGALLVGDAADFFDPFTGEGIRSALRGGEMAATALTAALSRGPTVRFADLAGYRRARRLAFRGKWAVERMIGYGMLAPRLFDRAVGRLDRRGMGHTLVGVTGDLLPAKAVLNPTFLMSMVV